MTDWVPMMHEALAALKKHICSAPMVFAQTSGQSCLRLGLAFSQGTVKHKKAQTVVTDEAAQTPLQMIAASTDADLHSSEALP